jgi:hypothetical protein
MIPTTKCSELQRQTMLRPRSRQSREIPSHLQETCGCTHVTSTCRQPISEPKLQHQPTNPPQLAASTTKESERAREKHIQQEQLVDWRFERVYQQVRFGHVEMDVFDSDTRKHHTHLHLGGSVSTFERDLVLWLSVLVALLRQTRDIEFL